MIKGALAFCFTAQLLLLLFFSTSLSSLGTMKCQKNKFFHFSLVISSRSFFIPLHISCQIFRLVGCLVVVFFILHGTQLNIEDAKCRRHRPRERERPCSCSVNTPKNANIAELSRPNIRLYEFNFNFQPNSPFSIDVAFATTRTNRISVECSNVALFHK